MLAFIEQTIPAGAFMRLGEFIAANLEPILTEWESFARSIVSGASMDALALRDHAGTILMATVHDMESSQSAVDRSEKAKGHPPRLQGAAALNAASELHAIDRLGSGFDLLEVVSEYRALRASVLRLWRDSAPKPHASDVDDVTRFNESIDQLITTAVASYTREVNQARDMFLAILSHDLRNPLNSIAMAAKVIPRLSPSEGSAKYSTQISTDVVVMGRMIGDLLDYTRTRLGTGMPVHPDPMDLGALGHAVIEEFRSGHPTRDIRFHCEGDLQGEWDADRLRQAISNILGNAIQHGDPAQPVELAMSNDGYNVMVEVRNQGDPIPTGELARIFDPLIRGSGQGPRRPNRTGSIGLGLYIAREVARSHGGRIDVTSTAADGTRFSMRLPRRSQVKSPPVMDEAAIKTM